MTKVKTEKSQTPYYIYAGAHAKSNEVTTSGTGTIATPPQQKGTRMYLGGALGAEILLYTNPTKKDI